MTRENLQADVDNTYSMLRRAMLDNDPYALRLDTQETLIELVRATGKLIANDPTAPLPELSVQLIIDAARHAGNNILSNVGVDQQYQLQQFTATRNEDYAATLATAFLHSLVDNWYFQLALSAYRDAEEEYSDARERLENAVTDFQTIAKIYHDGLINADGGMRALLWAARNTNAVKSIFDGVHESLAVPWFLSAEQYDKYATAAGIA